VNFEIENGLLFHIPLSGAPKLAIPKSCVQDIFTEAHDRNHHFGFDRTFKELDGFCIPGLTKQLRAYIDWCLSCLANTTLRTKANGSLQPIRSPPIPFYTIAMDFILALLEVHAVSPWKIPGFDIFNAMMTVTYKFAGKNLLIPGHDEYTVEDWATVLIMMLLLCD